MLQAAPRDRREPHRQEETPERREEQRPRGPQRAPMPRQPAASCVEALVWLIVRTVKGQPTGPLSGSTTLSETDVERFMAGDRGVARPTVRRASTMAAGALGAAMAKKEVVLSPRSHDRAVLAALDHYISSGGGSRGARAICDPAGTALPMSVQGPLDDVRFRPEREDDKASQITLRMAGGRMTLATRPNRAFDEGAKAFFERDWPAWLTGAIYDLPSPPLD